MRRIYYNEKPLCIYGIPEFETTQKLRRLPDALIERFTGQRDGFPRTGIRCPGARLAFKTNSKRFTVGIRLKTLSPDLGMSIYACQSAHVLIGERKNARFAGLASPESYTQKEFSGSFTKSAAMEDVTVFLPVTEIVETAWIEIEETAEIEAATPYTYPTPILFYGSSITEGAHATRPNNAYSALLSNRLDFDYYNFGFSSSAMGDPEMAAYIASLPIGMLVMDYDHNAPNAAHLQATHEPFFKLIRAKRPQLPVVMLSSPDFDYAADKAERRDIIRQTYLNAQKAGDVNVRFVDGETLFGEHDRHACTTDTIHPNDLGHYRIAERLEPIIRELLSNR